MYSAKEAAEMTGLSTAALRYYEKEPIQSVKKYIALLVQGGLFRFPQIEGIVEQGWL